ncbi:MAG: type II CRISPR-associated endonuclease Cas1 [Coriobacteriales bacterium]|jgi:CRISPR-associated endonuclease Cas1 subtype II|nr:type II CRISPR-associated endonuclease Cas1 [Coriobacteriales bacterium]
MGWRTVLIRDRCQLSHKLNYLTIKTAGKTERVFLDEVDCLLVESTSVYFNVGLTNELMRRKIAVIFCDKNHNPCSQLLPLSGAFDSRRKIVEQMAWTQEVKDQLWGVIIRTKIARQADVLQAVYDNKKGSEKLIGLSQAVLPGDVENLEAQGARHYFATIFGNEFKRKDMEWQENAALNYGYSVLLSAVNRAVTTNGYLTQLGIHHIGNENAFNLSCDLMEPFRPMVDRHLLVNSLWDLSPANKLAIVDVLNTQVVIEGQKQYLANALAIYCKAALDALSDADISLFVDYQFC